MDLVKWNKGGRWDYNDEGYYWNYCSWCNQKTEHESGSCIPCDNRMIARRAKKSVRSVTVSGSTGDHTVKIYPNGAKYCSCKGFKFRKTCSHIKGAV